MSVVTQNSVTKRMAVHAKGSPELISSLCTPSSSASLLHLLLFYFVPFLLSHGQPFFPLTVPSNFLAELNAYTIEGYRVIACASKFLAPESCPDIRAYQRNEAERDLIFRGLLVFENRVKPETIPSLKALRAASFRNVMITGDNVLTAIAVARDCAICKNNVPIYRLAPRGVEEGGACCLFLWLFTLSPLFSVASLAEAF